MIANCTLCRLPLTSDKERLQHERASSGHQLHVELFPSSDAIPPSLPLHLDALFIQYFRWNEKRISMLESLRRIIADVCSAARFCCNDSFFFFFFHLFTAKQGLFDLGRARYQQGSRAISTLSFDMTMQPLVRVEYETLANERLQ